jgi:UDP-GlcNAc:undecaprenyl-phosphate GlcNAc-1-phosphate transferase
MAINFNIVDRPNFQHKTHSEPVPYLGGIAIVVGVVVTSVILTFFFKYSEMMTLLSVLVPSVLLSIVGLLDDILTLRPFPRFVAQTSAGVFVAFSLVTSETFGNPTGSEVLDVLITIIFIVGLSNSINFFDNIDGGSSGTVAISSISLSLISFFSGQYLIASLSAVLAGSTIGFLYWNRNPARIYMGDAGSLFLGCLLASLLVRFEPNEVNFPLNFFVLLFLVATPLLDTTVVILSRLSRGISPFVGGRDHLSHRLIGLGISKSTSVYLLWTSSILYCLFAIIICFSSTNLRGWFTVFGSCLWIVCLLLFMSKKLNIAR